MVGRADDAGVELIAHIGEQVAEVLEGLGAFVLLGGAGQGSAVDIAQGDHLAELGSLGDISAPLAADADPGDRDIFQGIGAGAFHLISEANHISGAGDGGGLQKGTSRLIRFHC